MYTSLVSYNEAEGSFIYCETTIIKVLDIIWDAI